MCFYRKFGVTTVRTMYREIIRTLAERARQDALANRDAQRRYPNLSRLFAEEAERYEQIVRVLSRAEEEITRLELECRQ